MDATFDQVCYDEEEIMHVNADLGVKSIDMFIINDSLNRLIYKRAIKNRLNQVWSLRHFLELLEAYGPYVVMVFCHVSKLNLSTGKSAFHHQVNTR